MWWRLILSRIQRLAYFSNQHSNFLVLPHLIDNWLLSLFLSLRTPGEKIGQQDIVSFIATCACYAILMTVLHTLLNPQCTQRSNQYFNRHSKGNWVSSHLFMIGLIEQQLSKSSQVSRSLGNQQQPLIYSPTWFWQLDINCMKTQEKKDLRGILVSLIYNDQCELHIVLCILFWFWLATSPNRLWIQKKKKIVSNLHWT